MLNENEVSVNPYLKTITADIHLTAIEMYAAVKTAFVEDPDLIKFAFPFHGGYLHDLPFFTIDPDWEIRWVLVNGPEEAK